VTRPSELGVLSLGDCLADPVSGVRPTDAERHRAIVESAVHAEVLGFDSIWLGEHHFCDYVMSAPPVVLAAIAARTERIRLGTGVTLLANLDPVRVAEDYATLDGISSGRVELVAGRGILADTYAAFGQSVDESRERFRENLELLRRLWTETEVHWSGRFRARLDGVTVEPRPVQQPHPPLWIGGGSSAASVDLAAELGLPLMLPSVLAPPIRFLPLVERYRERFAKAGHDPGRLRVGACNHVHVGRASQQARAFWRPYYRNYLDFVERIWTHRERTHPKARVDFDDERLLEGVAICGSPAEVVDRIAATRQALGLDVHLLMFDLGGLPAGELARTLELFAAEVLPQLRSAERRSPDSLAARGAVR
jgi:alkanesulfonate monooxygenase SsuD/methylene tetrahydromethanopterin reductase-like flavin-dependent oxidoreductase (luciferase family)